MQTDFAGHGQKSKPITMPELDELQFKAIGEGLGFHQQEERPRWKSQSTLNTPTSTQARSTATISGNNISREQLGVIYHNLNHEQTQTKVSAKIKSKNVLKKAGMPERFSAQLVDTFIVTSAVAIMVFGMLLAAQVPMTQMPKLLTTVDVAPVVAILWLFSYMAYFTILETRQTPGKSLMRLKVADMQGNAMSLSQSLERTSFRTLSWLALGFPLLMDFHGRLSRTQVFRA